VMIGTRDYSIIRGSIDLNTDYDLELGETPEQLVAVQGGERTVLERVSSVSPFNWGTVYPNRYVMDDNQTLRQFIKMKRKSLKLTQKEMAEKAGVGLRFVRELERGKETLKMDKVNQVLDLFGYELGPQKYLRDEKS